MDEFMDEERVAGRLVRNGLGARAQSGCVAVEQRQCEVAALGRRQRVQSDLSPVQWRFDLCRALAERADASTRVAVLTTVTTDQQQRRRIRRPQEIDQTCGALGVAPLKIVDE